MEHNETVKLALEIIDATNDGDNLSYCNGRSCGREASFEYCGEYYCDECMLDALEQAGCIESYECSYKIYFDANENYIGDDFKDTDAIIDSCLKDIPELRRVD